MIQNISINLLHPLWHDEKQLLKFLVPATQEEEYPVPHNTRYQTSAK